MSECIKVKEWRESLFKFWNVKSAFMFNWDSPQLIYVNSLFVPDKEPHESFVKRYDVYLLNDLSTGGHYDVIAKYSDQSYHEWRLGARYDHPVALLAERLCRERLEAK